MGVQLYLIAVLICILLMISNVTFPCASWPRAYFLWRHLKFFCLDFNQVFIVVVES